MRKSNPEIVSLSKNKKAFHDYEILESFEAGIVLTGEEVKSIRDSQINLKGSFIDVFNEEAFMNEAHVSRYKFSSSKEYNPTRRRKLILHKKETHKIDGAISQKGVTAIPLEVYLKKGLIKIAVGICRGKKLYDKRDSLKKRDQKRDIDNAIKELR
jgi:SsrA-binding protein